MQLDPGHAHAWVDFGNAYHRMRKPQQALEAFEKALQADPTDGYTQRNLGGLLIMFDRVEEAVTHLRAALARMPHDTQTLLCLATALEKLGTPEATAEADRMYHRFITEHPNSPMVEGAEKSRTAIALREVKARSLGGYRPDVMRYISNALAVFEKQGPEARQAIALEIALLGNQGLDINNPEQKHSLKSLPGQFSGLHLLSIMYAAFRQIDPAMELGMDFEAEYQAAMERQKD